MAWEGAIAVHQPIEVVLSHLKQAPFFGGRHRWESYATAQVVRKSPRGERITLPRRITFLKDTISLLISSRESSLLL